ncbi:uncharacterized protein LOC129960631 [Argiope bruennichi]|uniref:Uncharacterized protein n=1 Tax=Argiope bruennichi TaxID=94029 RepID=A0A8T0FJU2_ARGBR|nr:uncharacterized protein LOC129960631 [Argiope bruennichi]XP_055930151.1 uncharacterized protein LOC129960631 [Argiope bruennichi]KAF8791504.1 hypothetical protein HNY73_006358 [Argiope bruennichi]
MENPLHTQNALSLKELTRRNAAILLWQQNIHLLPKFHLGKEYLELTTKDWNRLINKVKNKIPELQLVRSEAKEVELFIKPICFEIVKWVSYNDFNFFQNCADFVYCLDVLSWSSEGTINYKKTAENLVRLKPFDRRFLYEYACEFCLEDEVEITWKNLSDEEKAMYSEKMQSRTPQGQILHHWTKHFDYEMETHDMIFSACYDAATKGNLVATQYFFPKLENDQRKLTVQVLPGLADGYSFSLPIEPVYCSLGHNRDILDYLLTRLTFEEFMEFFETHYQDILSCYTDWNRQNKFFKILEKVRSSLPPEFYADLLSSIVGNMDTPVYNYQSFFREFFLKSPLADGTLDLKTQCPQTFYFSDLFLAGDIENIVFVLRNLSSATKEQLFTSDSGLYICLALIFKDEWALLQLFITECKLSIDVRSEIPEKFQLYITEKNYHKQIIILDTKLERFFNMLLPTEEIDHSKQKSEEEKESPK